MTEGRWIKSPDVAWQWFNFPLGWFLDLLEEDGKGILKMTTAYDKDFEIIFSTPQKALGWVHETFGIDTSEQYTKKVIPSNDPT